MVAKMVELRKGKMDEVACREALSKANYFGTMLVKLGYAYGLLGGATYSTADTVRPALQLIKTRPGNKIVSSCFIMHRTTANQRREVRIWLTALLTFSQPKMSLLKSLLKQPDQQRLSLLSQRLQCFHTVQWVLVRANQLIRYVTLQRSLKL